MENRSKAPTGVPGVTDRAPDQEVRGEALLNWPDAESFLGYGEGNWRYSQCYVSS